MDVYDVAIAGGGPAGTACGIVCAAAGLRTVVLEKAVFPREKVCGDCLNPGCLPVLEELGAVEAVLAAAHARLERVEFVGADERRIGFRLGAGEMGIRRSVLDAILLERCRGAGAEVREGAAIRAVSRDGDGLWRIEAGRGCAARRLVAADGRNSAVARLLGMAPPAKRDRVGLQAHAMPGNGYTSEQVEIHLFPEGYCGAAPVGGGVWNYCMVGRPERIEALKGSVRRRFGIDGAVEWRAITPLERAPVGPWSGGVFYAGDAARVVEPFTGEGISYALRSGALAGRHIADSVEGVAGRTERYAAAHAALYRGRMWTNRFARWVVTHPGAGGMLLRGLRAQPWVLERMVRRVTGVRGARLTQTRQ